ncbi:MAG: hypothetical protein FWE23_01285 [Chitinivibrionia bacterium]|nr:hypothetical protein [Chitinivibrionia bacterium]
MRLVKNNIVDNNDYEKMPILFTPFCKIETTKKVFSAIRRSRPKKLYVFSDGWRATVASEKENVEYLRKWVVENVDWDCEVFTNFQEKNLGTRFGIEAAIDWFFENEEMGIILEDDCLPAPSFFRFCSEILTKYKDEESVFLINGTNETAKNLSANTYSFKRITDFSEDITGIWGWATWRRAWIKHDKSMSQLEKYKTKREIDDNSHDYDEYIKNARIKILTDQMEIILSGRNNTWDLQLKFSALINNGLFVVPDCNLATNIGCGVADTAHNGFEYNVGAMLVAGEMNFPLEHPKTVAARPLTAREFRRASFFPILDGMDFWEMEMNITEEIRIINDFLDKTTCVSLEQKNEMYKPVVVNGIYRLLLTCLLFKEYAKAQKYFYLALSKGVLEGEKNFCAKCVGRKCLSACPAKSIFPYQTKESGFTVAINRKTCQYCWKCMKACPIVNPIN